MCRAIVVEEYLNKNKIQSHDAHTIVTREPYNCCKTKKWSYDCPVMVHHRTTVLRLSHDYGKVRAPSTQSKTQLFHDTRPTVVQATQNSRRTILRWRSNREKNV